MVYHQIVSHKTLVIYIGICKTGRKVNRRKPLTTVTKILFVSVCIIKINLTFYLELSESLRQIGFNSGTGLKYKHELDVKSFCKTFARYEYARSKNRNGNCKLGFQ